MHHYSRGSVDILSSPCFTTSLFWIEQLYYLGCTNVYDNLLYMFTNSRSPFLFFINAFAFKLIFTAFISLIRPSWPSSILRNFPSARKTAGRHACNHSNITWIYSFCGLYCPADIGRYSHKNPVTDTLRICLQLSTNTTLLCVWGCIGSTFVVHLLKFLV